jgi:alkylation response protein AidB-like acyl-CoA dehydrogenase
MDFTFTEQEEAYRAQVRGWLEKNIPDWWRQADATEFGEDDTFFEKQRVWHQALHDAGYVGVTWPTEYGGQGRSQIENSILQEELVRASAPPTVNGLGIGLCGPALIHHGTDKQRDRFLRPMLRAEEMWCQGYSEPGSGSDLASLQTRALLDGDTYVVNGQKIWTSGAHHADWNFCLVRTDPDAPKHGGIGFLLIDMSSTGIEIQPLVQITGHSGFSQVFYTDVRVPAENMVGSPTEGWRVANTVLGYERGAGALSRCMSYRQTLERIMNLARDTQRGGAPASRDPLLRQRIAKAAIGVEVLRLSSLRQLTALARGGKPGPESSIAKLYYSELEQEIATLGNSLAGPAGQLERRTHRSFDGGRFSQRELQSRGGTIYSGTSEIQRNIISERVLGLPRR